MQNLADYSGKPASIRVGGNSQDYSIYRDAMDDWLVKRNPDPVGQGDVAPTDFYIIGPRYFEAINRFPAGTPITFGLNMAYYEADYLDKITTMAEAAVTQLDTVNLTSFEVGNEPNIYLSNGFRNTTDGNWTGQTYVDEWTVRAKSIYSQVLEPAKLPVQFFEGPCSASLIMETFGINQLVTDGMQVEAKVEGAGDSTYLRSWNQHDYLYFIGQSNFSLTLNWLMGLNNTEWQFGHWADQVGVARATGLTYNLREMGSVGPVGYPGVSDTFGAALCEKPFSIPRTSRFAPRALVLRHLRSLPSLSCPSLDTPTLTRMMLPRDVELFPLWGCSEYVRHQLAHDRRFVRRGMETGTPQRRAAESKTCLLRLCGDGAVAGVREWDHASRDAIDRYSTQQVPRQGQVRCKISLVWFDMNRISYLSGRYEIGFTNKY